MWPIKDARQQKDFKKVTAACLQQTALHVLQHDAHCFSGLQAVHAMLMELEHDDKLPRRLVAAVPSIFATAAGQRCTLRMHC